VKKTLAITIGFSSERLKSLTKVLPLSMKSSLKILRIYF